MDDMTGGGGTPGAAIGGGLIQGLGMTSQILHSMFQNQRNRNFADTYAKKRFQWMVGDLYKAGINPIYAFGGGISGGGGGSVGGMIGPGGAPDFAQSARAAAMMGPEVRRLQAEAKRALWDTKTAMYSARAAEFNEQRAKAAWEKELATTRNIDASTDLYRVQQRLMQTQLPGARLTEQYYKHPVGQYTRYWQETLRNLFGGPRPPMPIYRGR